MVTTRAGSRETTPAASVRSGRTTTRRSTTGPVEAGTPSSRARAARRTGPTTARSGQSSHAYGVGTQAAASRVASRNLQGFSSALQDELHDQDEIGPEVEPDEPTMTLPPIIEDERRSASRESSVVSKASSSSSAASPSALIDHNKSFSNQREAGLRNIPVNLRDFQQPAPVNRPWAQQPPQQLVRQGPPVLERLTAMVTDLATGAKLLLSEYWKLLLGLLLALTFGSLLATYGIPTLDRIQPSPSGITHDYPSTATTTLISYINSPTDPAISNRLKHLESRVTHLEDELSRSAGTNPHQLPFNHISASIGATILPGYTSPTKRTASILLSPLAKLWTPPAMKGPLTALMPWSEPGQCWCTPADRASLGVRAPYKVRPSAVTIEHVVPGDLEDSGHNLETAPSLVEIWGRVGGDLAGDKEGCFGESPGPEFSCLGRMDLGWGRHGKEVRAHTTELFADVVAQDFVFVVLESRGAVGATCLYRVQLHGQKEQKE